MKGCGVGFCFIAVLYYTSHKKTLIVVYLTQIIQKN